MAITGLCWVFIGALPPLRREELLHPGEHRVLRQQPGGASSAIAARSTWTSSAPKAFDPQALVGALSRIGSVIVLAQVAQVRAAKDFFGDLDGLS
jgi:hypothetical protein